MSWLTVTSILLIIAGLGQIAMAMATRARNRVEPGDPAETPGRKRPSATHGFILGAVLLGIGLYSLIAS